MIEKPGGVLWVSTGLIWLPDRGAMSEKQSEGLPKREAVDVVHAVVKAGLSAIPYAGGAASELLSLVIGPPLEKRRDNWLEGIATRLEQLEKEREDFKVEDLAENESFVTAVLRATRQALATHRKEKLEALRNAVLNAALPNAPDDDLQLMFINFIEDLTPWHLRILSFLAGIRTWAEVVAEPREVASQFTYAATIEQAFPALEGRGEFHNAVLGGLHQRVAGKGMEPSQPRRAVHVQVH